MKLGVRLADEVIKFSGKYLLPEWKYEVDKNVLDFVEENKGKVKAIVVAGVHTSFWDVFHDIRFMQENSQFKGLIKGPGKKSLFEGFMGFLIGGIIREYGAHPLDRSKGRSYLDSLMQTIKDSDDYMLGVYPEGTRSYVDEWKKGFMIIMKKLRIPIVVCVRDYRNRIFSFSEIISPDFLEQKGELAVWEKLQDSFSKEMAKYPEKYNENIIPQSVRN